uniref:F-box domain-containing protein n=1 Tax=Leersia perrieri TaxID=77586 RepID=A0A0D9VH83_9ORYZ
MAAPWRKPELIPGLPGDVAMECLARVPLRSHRAMRHVCRGWRRASSGEDFRRHRRAAGAEEHVVFLVQATPARGVVGDGKEFTAAVKCALAAANLTTGEWRRVEGGVTFFARCAAAGDGHVAVLGGWDPAAAAPCCLSRDVRVLDVSTGTWRRGAAMPDARGFFGCAGGGGGEVYVAGGHDESKNALRSAYAYDVAADAWRALPDMSEERDEPQLVVETRGNRVLAASGYPTDAQGAFKKTAEMYAGDGDWTSTGDILPKTCMAAVGGKVWAIGAGKGGVKEWDVAAGAGGGAWRDVADGPPGMKACVQAVGLGGGDGVFVFGKADDAAEKEGRHAAWVMDAGGAAWRRVAVPPGFAGFAYSAAAVRV